MRAQNHVIEPADRALERLDALLPTRDPVGTLLEWLEELRTEELDFFEGGCRLPKLMSSQRPVEGLLCHN